MLDRLIALSIKHASVVVILSGLLVVVAGVRLDRMPVDVFPELNAPTVVIMTEAGGLAADEVESFVTHPIETAMNGIPGTRRVRSASATSLSMVWVEFDWSTDLLRARQLVDERLDTVRENLPPEAHAEIAPTTSISGEVMLVAVSSPEGMVSPLELRAWAEFEMRQAILSIPGIAQVVAIGGELPEYRVAVDQERLAGLGLTITDVVDAARGAHSTASAGYLADVGRREIPIRQMARVNGIDDVAATLVDTIDGDPITIGQIADVSIAAAPARGAAGDSGLPAVVVSIKKSPGANTLDLTEKIDTVLDELTETMPKGMVLNREPFRAARFVQRSVDNVVKVLIEAVVIVAIIILLFLVNARSTLITLTALPVSIAIAILVLDAWGLAINVMTLGGLAVAIGELVDDAIIDVENVLRRLRGTMSLARAKRPPATETILTASTEIRGSVVFATVIICLVFAPLLFLDGLEGRFFRPLGVAYVISILASLLVALTLTPALCRLLLASRFDATADGSPLDRHRDGGLVRWLKHRYRPALESAMRKRALVLGSAGTLALAAIGLGSTYGTSFLPTFNEGTFTVFVMAPPGTSLAESDRLGRGIESRLAEIEGVSSVVRRTGRAERDEHAEPVSSSEIEVVVSPEGDADRIRVEIDQVLEAVPGVVTMVGQPIEHRLSHLLSGTPAAIAINVRGDDLDGLRKVARRIETALKQIPGTRDVAANREVMITSLPIRYRPTDLAAMGLTPADAANQVRQALHGETVAEINQGVRRTDLVVRLADDRRERTEQIGDLVLHGRHGSMVRLRDVADIEVERTSNLIARENARRKAVISTNVADGYNLGDLAEEVRRVVDPIVIDSGFTVHYGGQFEARQSAARTLAVTGSGIAVVMFLLLRISTGRNRIAALVMMNLPLALIGGVVAIFLMESPSIPGNTLALFGIGGRYVAPVVSIASLVGFITLFGIAVRNGILLVNHIEHVHRHEGRDLHDAILTGSLERLTPILMTALTAALGLVPLALSAGEPGSELLAPLAIVVLGGLLTSTLLNLFVVPAGYAVVFRVPKQD
ncbi:MAG: CusA/CzcA family heavy metal efflux RND transporter [Planctomycetaceae bacterium]|nr:CusA/CzcA family heavy metal efflux RND transporter [Planctomycetaceae bacterium]